ncbi:MAG TPA: hypothetical protein VEB86_04325 [Chryseosolibacter sp.]|nr:hypothetical protein [Chryseosolibacter sp.]
MAKDREGKFHTRKGKPSGPGKIQGTTGLKNINSDAIDNYLEIADKYTLGEEQPAPNVHLRHPNRNPDKGEDRGGQRRDTNNEPNVSNKTKTETFRTDSISTAVEELPTFLSKEQLAGLSSHQAQYCISAYMETHSSGVEKNEQKDVIGFKNILQQLTSELRNKGADMTTVERLLKPGYDLIRNDKFWLNVSKGLAVFISDGQFKLMKLPFSPKTEVLINSSYYLSPLMPLITARDYFYLLVLSKKQAKLYRADQFGMVHIPVPEMPDGIDDVVHFENKDDQKLFRTDTSGAGHGANFHGIGSGKPDDKQNIAMYFDEVDETLWKDILKTENAPLLLAGVEYLIPIYKSVAQYKCIWDEPLKGNFEYEDETSLYEQAMKKMKSFFAQRHEKALEMFGNQSATGLTSSIAEDVIPAAHYSKVWHLFVARDEHIWGRFDEMNNEITIHNEKQDGDECLLDKAMLRTIQNGGEVHVLEKDRMPGGSKVAALMRY